MTNPGPCKADVELAAHLQAVHARSCGTNGAPRIHTELAEADPYRQPVGWLRCCRGFDTLTAILLLAELHDTQRFRRRGR